MQMAVPFFSLNHLSFSSQTRSIANFPHFSPEKKIVCVCNRRFQCSPRDEQQHPTTHSDSFFFPLFGVLSSGTRFFNFVNQNVNFIFCRFIHDIKFNIKSCGCFSGLKSCCFAGLRKYLGAQFIKLKAKPIHIRHYCHFYSLILCANLFTYN